MIFPNTLLRRARADKVRDRSVVYILLLLLGLVFAPALGMHAAMAALETVEAPAATPF